MRKRRLQEQSPRGGEKGEVGEVGETNAVGWLPGAEDLKRLPDTPCSLYARGKYIMG